MDDLGFGRAMRAVRVRRGWRQQDLADRAHVSRTIVSRVERGLIDDMPLSTLRRACAPLDVRVQVQPRGRGADLDRVVNERHSALHEAVARVLTADYPAWILASEVSFNIRGERGVIDLLLWHPARRALLIIELKTELVDLGELLATADRRVRLARDIVRERGWVPATVSVWVIVARSRTTERRIADHRAMLRSALPDGGPRLRAWLRDPVGVVRGLSTWAIDAGPTRRVATPRQMRIR